MQPESLRELAGKATHLVLLDVDPTLARLAPQLALLVADMAGALRYPAAEIAETDFVRECRALLARLAALGSEEQA